MPAALLPQADEGWLRAAARPRPVTDEYEQLMATLIHDLKNEVTAAKVALERPTASRTEQLAARHAASEHLDRMADLGSRLRDADLLYSAANLVGVTDLAPFLQAYISDQIRRLPQQVRLVPPTLTPASVAIEERALRAILDNLVKNAQEAMPEGGTITIDYASFLDDYRCCWSWQTPAAHSQQRHRGAESGQPSRAPSGAGADSGCSVSAASSAGSVGPRGGKS